MNIELKELLTEELRKILSEHNIVLVDTSSDTLDSLPLSPERIVSYKWLGRVLAKKLSKENI